MNTVWIPPPDALIEVTRKYNIDKDDLERIVDVLNGVISVNTDGAYFRAKKIVERKWVLWTSLGILMGVSASVFTASLSILASGGVCP